LAAGRPTSTAAGQVRWLAGAGIDPLRGRGRIAGTGAVEVNGVRYTAEHIVIQPFPTFSEIYAEALKALAHDLSAARRTESRVAS